MKKLVLAAAIAAIASNAMASVEVYNADGTTVNVFGEIRTRLRVIDNDDKGAKFDMSGSKLGVEAKHQINDDLTAKGYVRYSADLNESGSVDVSKGYIALESNTWGTVGIGKQGSVYDSLFGGYDASTLFGGSAKMGDDKYGTDTVESAAVYTWSNDSFTVMAQSSFADEDAFELKAVAGDDGDTVLLKGKMDGTRALGASWSSDFGLTLATAYTIADIDNDTTEVATKGKESQFDALAFEAGYSIGAWTLGAAVFQHEMEADKNDAWAYELNNVGLGVAYKLDNGITAFAGYDIQELNDTTANDKDIDFTHYNVGLEYWPHASVKTFVEYANTEKDFKEAGKKTIDSDKFGIGARVYF